MHKTAQQRSFSGLTVTLNLSDSCFESLCTQEAEAGGSL